MRVLGIFAIIFALGCAAACSSSSESLDSGARDAGGADASVADAVSGDGTAGDATNADASNADASNADANRDAGAPDADPADATNADADPADADPADATNADADPADATNADADPADARTPDASNADAEAADTGVGDSGVHADAMAADSGAPDAGSLPCFKDQGGPADRGCNSGEVCNLAMNPPQCVPGRACTTDTDCNPCSNLPSPTDCGHGFNLVAFCDPRHGNVCTRSRAPCEPCTVDLDCGRRHPILPFPTPNRCLDYGGGQFFCGRACGACPDGFYCDATTSQCRAMSCDPTPVICPPDNMTGPACAGSDQICPGEECPGTGGARCSTNDEPFTIGICIGYCVTDADCPPTHPTCNPSNGLCIM